MEPLPPEKNDAHGTKLCVFDVSSSYQDAGGMGLPYHKRKRERNQDHFSNVGSGTNHVFANDAAPRTDTLKCCKHEDDDPEVAFIGESTSDYKNKQLMKFVNIPLEDHFLNVDSGTNHVFVNAVVPLTDTLKCCKHEDDDPEVTFIGESTSDYKNKQLTKFVSIPLKDHFLNVSSGTNHVFANAVVPLMDTLKCCKHEDDDPEVAFIGESTSDYKNKQLVKFVNMPLKDHFLNVDSGTNHVFVNAVVPLTDTVKCCKHEDDDPEVAFIGESTSDYKNKQLMKFVNIPLKDRFLNMGSGTNHVFANAVPLTDTLKCCKHEDDDPEVAFIGESTSDYKNKQPMKVGKYFNMPLKEHFLNVGSGANYVFANAVVPLTDTLKCCKHEHDDPEVAFIGESTSDYKNKQPMKLGKCFNMPLKDHFSNVGSGTNHVFANAVVPPTDTRKCCKHDDDDPEVVFVGESTSDYKNKQPMKFGKGSDMPLKDDFSNAGSSTYHVFANVALTPKDNLKSCKHEDDNLEVVFVGESTKDNKNKQPMNSGKGFDMALKPEVVSDERRPIGKSKKSARIQPKAMDDEKKPTRIMPKAVVDEKKPTMTQPDKGFDMPSKDDFSNMGFGTNRVFDNVDLPSMDTLKSSKPVSWSVDFADRYDYDGYYEGFEPDNGFYVTKPEVVVNAKKPSRIQPEVGVTAKKPKRIPSNVGGNGKKPNKIQRKLVVDEKRPTRKPRKQTRIQPEVVSDERRPIGKSKKSARIQPKAMDDEKKPTRTMPKAVVDEKKPTMTQPDKGFDMPSKDDFSNMGFGTNHVFDNVDLPSMDTLKSSKPVSWSVDVANRYDYDGYYEVGVTAKKPTRIQPNVGSNGKKPNKIQRKLVVDERRPTRKPRKRTRIQPEVVADERRPIGKSKKSSRIQPKAMDDEKKPTRTQPKAVVDENKPTMTQPDKGFDMLLKDIFSNMGFGTNRVFDSVDLPSMDTLKSSKPVSWSVDFADRYDYDGYYEVGVTAKKPTRIQPNVGGNGKKPNKIQRKLVVDERRPTRKSRKRTRIQPEVVADERRPIGKSKKPTRTQPKAIDDEKKPTRTQPKAVVDEKKPTMTQPDKGFDMPLKDVFSNMGFGTNRVFDNVDLPSMDTLKSSKPVSWSVDFADRYDYDGYYEGFEPGKGLYVTKDDFSNMGFGTNHVLDNVDLPPMDTMKSSKPVSQGVNFADRYDYDGNENDGYYEGFEPNYYDNYEDEDYYVDDNYDEDYYEDDYYDVDNYEGKEEPTPMDPSRIQGKEEPTPMDLSRIQTEVVVNVKKRSRIQPKGVVNVKKATKIQAKLVVKEKKPTKKSQKPTRIQSNVRVNGKKPTGIKPKAEVEEKKPTGIKPKAEVDEKRPTGIKPKAEVDEKRPIWTQLIVEVDEKKPIRTRLKIEVDEKKPTGIKPKAEVEEKKPTGIKLKAEVDEKRPTGIKPKAEVDEKRPIWTQLKAEVDEKKPIRTRLKIEVDEKKPTGIKPKVEVDEKKPTAIQLTAEVDDTIDLKIKAFKQFDTIQRDDDRYSVVPLNVCGFALVKDHQNIGH